MLDKILLTFLIALFYVLGAQLGFLLSVLPDTSITLFWPPSGIALAAVLLLGRKALAGVFLGVLVTALMGLQALSFGAMLGVALTMSIATTLAIFVAAKFLMRFAPSAPVWDSAADLLVGSAGMGLACTISAFFGARSLYLSGMLPIEEITRAFSTWWLGEFCGMIIFTPLAFAVARRNTGKFWRKKRPDVVLSPTILNSVIAAIALASYLALWIYEGNNISSALERAADIAANNLTQALHTAEDDIVSVRSFMNSSRSINNEEFQRYAAAQFGRRNRDPGTQAVGWAPRVFDSNVWELEMLQTGDAQIRLYEVSDSGEKIPVSKRDDYFPLQFLYPLDDVNRKALGFDLGSEKSRREALDTARDTGATRIVAPVIPVQSHKAEPAMLICQPIYRPGETLDTIEDRRTNLVGIASGVYLLAAVFEKAFADTAQGVDLHVIDEALPEGEQPLYTSAAAFDDNAKSTNAPPTTTILDDRFFGTAQIEFAGRNWLVKATAGPNFIKSQRTWIPWGTLILLLALGMVVSSILIERISARKRIQVERQKTETALLEARAANESKSYFMAAASHDIKQPLYALSILTDTLLMSDPPGATKPIIKSLSKSIKQMSRHFDTLMDVGRFQDGSFEATLSNVSVKDLSSRIDLEIAPLCREKKLEWVLEMEDVLVHTDAELLLRMMRNLLTNAVRYTAEGRVTCTAIAKDEFVQFEIADTGDGLSANEQELMFSAVTRLRDREIHTSVHGLGLSIVNKIGLALDLDLSVISNATQGTSFTFRISRARDQ